MSNLDELERKVASGEINAMQLFTKMKQLIQIPMKYRRMEFNAQLQEEVAELKAKLAESEKECSEQARLNGMGSEREAAQLSKIDRLTAKSEPVAWMKRVITTDDVHVGNLYSDRKTGAGLHGSKIFYDVPLYTSPQVPEGYVLVPIEPTDAMLEQCGTIQNYGDDTGTADKDHIDWYKSMIAASKAPA